MTINSKVLTGIMVIIALALFNCALWRAELGSPGNPITMEYNQEAGTANKYKFTSNSSQDIDQAGQVFTMTVNAEGEVLHKIGKITGDKITHELSYTSFSVQAQSDVSGTTSINADNVLNIPLLVVTGKSGEDVDLPNYKELPVLSGEPMPAALGLMGMLPELSKDPVTIMDKWTSSLQSIELDLPPANAVLNINTEYTFEGIEKKMGYDCMKITGLAESKVELSFVAEGIDVDMIKTGNSEITAFFAFKEGFFVEISSQGKSESTLDAPAANVTQKREEISNTTFVLIK